MWTCPLHLFLRAFLVWKPPLLIHNHTTILNFYTGAICVPQTSTTNTAAKTNHSMVVWVSLQSNMNWYLCKRRHICTYHTQYQTYLHIHTHSMFNAIYRHTNTHRLRHKNTVYLFWIAVVQIIMKDPLHAIYLLYPGLLRTWIHLSNFGCRPSWQPSPLIMN